MKPQPLPLFLAPYIERRRARAQLALTCELVANAIEIVGWREALALEAVDARAPSYVIRRARAAVENARADADEAELLYRRAIVEWERVHVRPKVLTAEEFYAVTATDGAIALRKAS